MTLKTDTGLIEVYSYYSETTTGSGGYAVEGFKEYDKFKKGSGGIEFDDGDKVVALIRKYFPDDVDLLIHTGHQALGSDNYADRGLTRSGDTWTRAGFETAAQRIELDTDANLGSIT